MTKPKFADHTVRVFHDEVRSWVIQPNDDGDVEVQEIAGGGEVESIDDTWLQCDTCHRLGDDELADHGISEEWQEV